MNVTNPKTGLPIGWDEKSEIMQGYYAINYAIFLGLIYIVLPGFKGE